MRPTITIALILLAALTAAGCGGDNLSLCDGCGSTPTPSVTLTVTPTPTGETPSPGATIPTPSATPTVVNTAA